MAMDHVVNSITNANGEFDDDARKSLAFWLPKAYLDTGIISDRHVGFLLVQRTKKPTFTAENGTLLSTDQFGDPSIVSIENKGGTPVVALKWTDRAGSKTVVITHTSDAHALKAFGTWRSPTEDDIP